MYFCKIIINSLVLTYARERSLSLDFKERTWSRIFYSPSLVKFLDPGSHF